MSSLYLFCEYALLVQGEIITFKCCLEKEKSRLFANLFLEDADGGAVILCRRWDLIL